MFFFGTSDMRLSPLIIFRASLFDCLLGVKKIPRFPRACPAPKTNHAASYLLMRLGNRVFYTYGNRKKAALLRDQPELAADPMIAFMDMTDGENPVFQYTR